jgi:hypothetical protein
MRCPSLELIVSMIPCAQARDNNVIAGLAVVLRRVEADGRM